MKVQVAKWGNSTAVRLPKAVVKQLGLAQGMLLEVSVDGGVVKLEPSLDSGTAGGSAVAPPEPYPVTREWLIAEAERLGGLKNAPDDDFDWGPDVGSEVIDDDYNPRRKAL